jgi:hypothetical protein
MKIGPGMCVKTQGRVTKSTSGKQRFALFFLRQPDLNILISGEA